MLTLHRQTLACVLAVGLQVRLCSAAKGPRGTVTGGSYAFWRAALQAAWVLPHLPAICDLSSGSPFEPFLLNICWRLLTPRLARLLTAKLSRVSDNRCASGSLARGHLPRIPRHHHRHNTQAAFLRGVAMSTAADMDGLAEKGETRVMGLGVGVFLIFFFSLVAVVICLIGATTPRPGTFACGGAGLLGFVVFLLFVAEQDSRYVEDKSDQIQDYDQTFYPRLVTVLILGLAVLLGLGGLCVTHIGKPLYAIPVYDQRTSLRRPIF